MSDKVIEELRKEFNETLTHLLKQTRKVNNGRDANYYAQAVLNLLSCPFPPTSTFEIRKE